MICKVGIACRAACLTGALTMTGACAGPHVSAAAAEALTITILGNAEFEVGSNVTFRVPSCPRGMEAHVRNAWGAFPIEIRRGSADKSCVLAFGAPVSSTIGLATIEASANGRSIKKPIWGRPPALPLHDSPAKNVNPPEVHLDPSRRAVNLRRTGHFTWLPAGTSLASLVSDSLRHDVQEGYARALAQLARARADGNQASLLTCFEGEALEQARVAVHMGTRSALFREEIDIDHELQVADIDAKLGTLTLVDYAASVYRVDRDRRTHEAVNTEFVAADWSVRMRLREGIWRVSALTRQAESSPTPPPRLTGSGGRFVRASGTSLIAPDGGPLTLRGFNYYPSQAAWEKFFPKYSKRQVELDLEAIARAGANVLRIFIHVEACAAEGSAWECQEKLQHLLETSRHLGLYVIATLFDFQPGYSLDRWHAADRYLEQWVTPFSQEPALLGWDLKNEPDLDRRNAADDVDRFLQFFLERVRVYDTNHLLTIGWQSNQTACDLAGSVDFISYHDYGDPATIGERAKRVLGRCGSRPVVLGEFGTPSDDSAPISQYDYFDSAAASLASVMLAGTLIWTWNDFDSTPTSVSGGNDWAASRETRFGMLDLSGEAKPAFSIVREHFLNRAVRK